MDREGKLRKQAADLSEEDLRTNGLSYQLDYSQLQARLGEQAEERVLDLVRQGLQKFSGLFPSRPSKKKYLIWMLQRGIVGSDGLPTMGLLVILSPLEEELLQCHPVERILSTLPEFIRRQPITPLYEGALPFFECSEDGVFQLESTIDFLRLADRILARIMKETGHWDSNIYREILREIEEEN